VANPFDPDEDMPAAPPEATPFDPWARTGALGAITLARMQQEAAAKRRDIGGADLGPGAYLDPKWRGLHGYAGPWEDERGTTLNELKLKADYLKSQGDYGAYPRRPVGEISTWEPEDTPVTRPVYPGAGDPRAGLGPAVDLEGEKRRALMMEYNKRLEERRKKK